MDMELDKQFNQNGQKYLVGDYYTLADVLMTVLCARAYFKREKDMFGAHVRIYWDRMK